MLYYLSEQFGLFGPTVARLMDYLTVRSGLALLLSLFIALAFGEKVIRRLQLMQVGEIVRNLGIEGQMKKTGTPTMGGIIIIISILIPTILIGNLGNVYMMLMIVTTLWMGVIGFLDDYLKIHRHNKDGMKGSFKIIGQVGLGIIVGLTMVASPAVVIRENVATDRITAAGDTEIVYQPENVKAAVTTLPFVKNHNFNYEWLTEWCGEYAAQAGWVVFVLVVIIAVSATSNGANLTDGLDGLCTGTSAIIGVALAIMAYLGGNVMYASYLNIMYVPESGEMVVYLAAFIGALIGFLWYNAYPAQVFMGDTGSLTIGGIVAVAAILIRKELLIPILCAIYFAEDLSVMLQVAYFKITKRKYGAGKRIFKMTPLHHHFQKEGNAGIDALWQKPLRAIPESKIVTRFWIVGIFLAAITFVTLKIR